MSRVTLCIKSNDGCQFCEHSVTPKTKEELKRAVNLWCDNKKEAIKKYGDINTWNVHNITDMSELFMNCYYFDDNIGDFLGFCCLCESYIVK